MQVIQLFETGHTLGAEVTPLLCQLPFVSLCVGSFELVDLRLQLVHVRLKHFDGLGEAANQRQTLVRTVRLVRKRLGAARLTCRSSAGPDGCPAQGGDCLAPGPWWPRPAARRLWHVGHSCDEAAPPAWPGTGWGERERGER